MKNCIFYLGGYQKYFFWIWFLTVWSLSNLGTKHNLACQKEREGKEPFIFHRKKDMEFEMWILTDFSLNNGSKFIFQTQYLFYSKNRKLVDPAFFVNPNFTLCQTFIKIAGMVKNVKRKTFGTHRTLKIAIFQKISMVPCFVRERAPSYQVLHVIGEISNFWPILTTTLL